MTRHQRFDVHIASDVLESIELARSPCEQATFFDAVDRPSRYGTRAPGARKLKALDMWEVRFGDSRAFFALVPGKRAVALGAVAPKKSRRLRMSHLRTVERQVHEWRHRLEDEG